MPRPVSDPQPCPVDGCSNFRSGPYCTGHQSRLDRGKLLGGPLRSAPRFNANDPGQVIARLLMSRSVVGTCWEWTGARSAYGYGQVGTGGALQYAHRLAAFAYDVPGSGPLVLHHCDNPPCFNPIHLYRGTHLDNTLDSVRRGRSANWGRGASHASA